MARPEWGSTSRCRHMALHSCSTTVAQAALVTYGLTSATKGTFSMLPFFFPLFSVAISLSWDLSFKTFCVHGFRSKFTFRFTFRSKLLTSGCFVLLFFLNVISSQDRDLERLRRKWLNALTKRQEYLDQQLQKLVGKPGKHKQFGFFPLQLLPKLLGS